MPKRQKQVTEVCEATTPEQARAVLELVPSDCDREYWHSHTVVKAGGTKVWYRIHCKSGSQHCVAVKRSELRKIWGRGHPPQVWFARDPDSDEKPGGITFPEHAHHNPMRFPVVD